MKSLTEYINEAKKSPFEFRTTWNKFWHFRFDIPLKEKMYQDTFEEWESFFKYGLMGEGEKIDNNEIDPIDTRTIYRNYNDNDEILVKCTPDRNTIQIEIEYDNKKYSVAPMTNVNDNQYCNGKTGMPGIEKWVDEIKL